jgi:hypothetical protein
MCDRGPCHTRHALHLCAMLHLLPTMIVAAAALLAAAATAAPVQVFILMGQSNMLGMGHVVGNTTNGTLEFAVHNESKCE